MTPLESLLLIMLVLYATAAWTWWCEAKEEQKRICKRCGGYLLEDEEGEA